MVDAGPLGLVLAERRGQAWGPDELALAVELRPSACVVPVHGDVPAEVRAARVAFARTLLERTEARLLLRAAEPDLPQWAPTDWAGECARRAGFFAGDGRGEKGIEMIPGEALDLAGGAAASWLLRVAQRYRRLRRGDRLHLPAPDPAAAAAFWKACARAEVGKRFDVVDVQKTADEQVRALPRLAHELRGLPVDLTAWERVDPLLVAAEVRAHPWLVSACYADLAGLIEQPVLLARFCAAQFGAAGHGGQDGHGGQGGHVGPPLR